jgi:RNA polymerase sigma-70 factor (ECF subfamily)
MADAPAQKTEWSQALAEHSRIHDPTLVRFLTIRTGSAEDAKEVLQEAYARLLALHRPGTISLLGGYLWRTAVNLAMDRRRQQAVRNRFTGSVVSLAEKLDSSAEWTCEARERLAIVERAISELSPKCLEAFVLHVLNGLKHDEVGQKMGISPETARKYVARSLEYLQTCLDAADVTRSKR